MCELDLSLISEAFVNPPIRSLLGLLTVGLGMTVAFLENLLLRRILSVVFAAAVLAGVATVVLPNLSFTVQP